MICVPFNVMPSIASSYPLLACLTVLVSFLLAADTGLVDTICLAAADAQGDYGDLGSPVVPFFLFFGGFKVPL